MHFAPPKSGSKTGFPLHHGHVKELDHVVQRTSERSCAGYSGFIRVQDGVFVDGACKEVTISGYNAWKVVLQYSGPES